ncbi:MAG: tRNA 2-thiouridine(34) synthase MnmA [Thioalkalispiraceae bacterium]|jgi:tRNA-specific 2-thiouridylase
MDKSDKNIIVGISGGVDSSVSALLLKQQGYDVHAVFMKNWEADDLDDYCPAEQDFSDARQVCKTLGIEIHGVNFSDQYWDRVFNYFLEEYAAGRTPNPDILCNKEIKFRAFLDYALTQGADKIATGHYVRSEKRDGEFFLLRGKDTDKDQSYFLYTLQQDQLEKSIFPVGELTKPEVRQLAEQNHLITYNKKDSTGICFIGERDFKTFLQRYIPAQPGKIVTPEGDKVGRHDGLMYYTRGQRQGLGIGGLANYSEEPWYVADKDLVNNELIVVQGHDHELLKGDWLKAAKLEWVSKNPPGLPLTCTAKTRYRQKDSICHLNADDDNRLLVQFEEPQWAITPGQSVVFYQDEVCLGGGIIEQTQKLIT